MNPHYPVLPIGATRLVVSVDELEAVSPRLHAVVRNMQIVIDSDATTSIAYDGERIHLARECQDGPMSSMWEQTYALAIVAELIAMEAVERIGGRDARTWSAACMMVAVANLRMSGVFLTPARCAPFDVPMYDGMKPSSLYDRLVELEKAPRQMIGLMTMDDL